MLNLRVEMQKLGDAAEEIKHFVENANADVWVGFLDGKYHVPTLHKEGKGKKAQYKGYDGEPDPQNAIPVENSELAKTLSFGSATIPARPFIEEGLLSKKDELSKEIETQLENVKKGQPANWEKVGTKAVGAVQEFVRGDYYKSTIPNSEKTIKYKGSDTPLIDGGDLINSLEFVVE